MLARLPTRKPWEAAIREMVQALGACGATLMVESEVMAASALEHAADVIVVATGARWSVPSDPAGPRAVDRPTGLPRLSLDRAVDLATRGVLPVFGKHTMIVDGTGTYAPLGFADLLLSRGIRVTFVTHNESIGHVAHAELELPHVLPRLEREGIDCISGHRLTRVNGRIAALEPVSGGSLRFVSDVDAVVYSVLRVPVNDLWMQLKDRHADVRCIGDAVSPRTTAAVIQEGEELARSL
jgi:hypothetical protein